MVQPGVPFGGDLGAIEVILLSGGSSQRGGLCVVNAGKSDCQLPSCASMQQLELRVSRL